ncbi:hypothetical protein SCH4B_2200 [Ruegeria sp. TrichCH4B]|nr:hypothetical protein SCH4B_2200 [Ruegeria sp. TrichCH4B]
MDLIFLMSARLPARLSAAEPQIQRKPQVAARFYLWLRAK